MNRKSAAVIVLLSLVAAGPAKRAPKDVEAAYAATMAKLEGKYTPADIVDPKYRKSLTDQAVPVLVERLALVKEMSAGSPANKAKARWRLAKTAAKLAFYKDPAGQAALDEFKLSTDAADAIAGDLAARMLAWWEAAEKPDEQATVLDAVAKLATEQPKNDDVPQALKSMIDENCATPALAARAWDTIATIKTPTATQLNATPNKVGKPLVFAGQLVTGKQFKSDSLKGKVVMIDFWATWCPPCREELPRLAKLYAENHDKGFEIVGVSSDQGKRELVDFLKQHPELPWPQLFQGGAAWHPLTKKYEIRSIPQMYLIDRAGVLRSVTARRDVEKLLPDLLAEAAPEATAKK